MLYLVKVNQVAPSILAMSFGLEWSFAEATEQERGSSQGTGSDKEKNKLER